MFNRFLADYSPDDLNPNQLNLLAERMGYKPIGTVNSSDIAYNAKTTSTNVIGAIRGMGSRYREDESLISLNIVEQVDASKNLKIYKLTDFGKELIESMKEKR